MDVEVISPVQQQKFGFSELFGFTNYYSRQRYWAVKILAYLASIILPLVFGMLAALAPVLFVFVFIAGLLVGWVSFVTSIKRLRDAGLSLYWALLEFIPFVNLIMLVVFGCVGSSPLKNNGRIRGVIWSAVAIIVVPVVIVVALVVMGMRDFASAPRVKVETQAETVTDVSSSLVGVSGTVPVIPPAESAPVAPAQE